MAEEPSPVMPTVEVALDVAPAPEPKPKPKPKPEPEPVIVEAVVSVKEEPEPALKEEVLVATTEEGEPVKAISRAPTAKPVSRAPTSKPVTRAPTAKPATRASTLKVVEVESSPETTDEEEVPIIVKRVSVSEPVKPLTRATTIVELPRDDPRTLDEIIEQKVERAMTVHDAEAEPEPQPEIDIEAIIERKVTEALTRQNTIAPAKVKKVTKVVEQPATVEIKTEIGENIIVPAEVKVETIVDTPDLLPATTAVITDPVTRKQTTVQLVKVEKPISYRSERSTHQADWFRRCCGIPQHPHRNVYYD